MGGICLREISSRSKNLSVDDGQLACFKESFESGNVKREDIFVTSKLWNNAHKKEDVNYKVTNLFDSVKDEFEAIAGIVEEAGNWSEV